MLRVPALGVMGYGLFMTELPAVAVVVMDGAPLTTLISSPYTKPL